MPTTIEDIVERVRAYSDSVDSGLLTHAHEFAVWAHEDTPDRKSGEPFISHPLAVAEILTEIEADPYAVAAGLLHDVVEENEATQKVTIEGVRKEFGPIVGRIVDGVTRVGKLKFRTRQEERARDLRKMLLAMAEDVRVITVKLADRLHNMRTLEFMPPEHQERKALETRMIYAPLAHRLGVWRLKWELEDWALKYLDREAYDDIVRRLGQTRAEREKEIEKVRAEAAQALAAAGIDAEVYGRPKHIYSIYNKMRTQELEFDQIGDIMALRILVNSIDDCYPALGVVHRTWMPLQGQFTDYIAKPKANHYQSLHTKVMGPNNRAMEVQIRTREMHRVAEYGMAAHWSYKEGKPDHDLDKRLEDLRKLLELETDLEESHEFLELLHHDLLKDRIIVFTPQGEVLDLPAGSTPVDFAYRIHTEVGHHCVGARVNGRQVPLDYRLGNNDVAEILTSPHAEPSRDWLQFIQSSHAKAKIRKYLREKTRDENIALGQEVLQRELARLRPHDRERLDLRRLEEVARHLKYPDTDNLHAAIGYGDVEPATVISHLRALAGPRSLAEEVAEFSPRGGTPGRERPQVTSEGVKGFSSRLSKCCSPLPGDEIVGYITRGEGLAIHRADCKSLLYHAEREPERVLPLSWESREGAGVSQRVNVVAVDRVGLFSHITAVVADLGLNITAAEAHLQAPHIASLTLTVQIPNRKDLDELVQHLSSLIDVVSVRPVSGA